MDREEFFYCVQNVLAIEFRLEMRRLRWDEMCRINRDRRGVRGCCFYSRLSSGELNVTPGFTIAHQRCLEERGRGWGGGREDAGLLFDLRSEMCLGLLASRVITSVSSIFFFFFPFFWS